MGLRRWNKDTQRWDSFGSPQVNPATIGAAAATHAAAHASQPWVLTSLR